MKKNVKPVIIECIEQDPFTFIKVSKDVEVQITTKSRKIHVPTVTVTFEGTGIAKRNTDMKDNPNTDIGKKFAYARACKDLNRKIRNSVDHFCDSLDLSVSW
jgi:hypothetical protein